MATIKEKLSGVRNYLVAAMMELGIAPTVVASILLVIVLAVGFWFAWGGVTSYWETRKQDKEIAAARADKEKAVADKEAAETRATYAEGKLNELETQKAQLQSDYNIVLARYRELRVASDAARNEYVNAKRKGIVLNGGVDLSNRFRDLSGLLDGMDSDTNP